MFFYTFIPKLINMSLTASVAIVLVMLLRLLLKKTPKVISYALWGIVLLRLLCPVSIGSSFSLYNIFNASTAETGTLASTIEYVPTDIVHTEYPSVVLPVPGVSEAINEVLHQGGEQLAADPLEAPVVIAAYVWMAGILVMAVCSAVTYVRLRRRLLTASPLRDNIYLVDEIASPCVMGLLRPRIYLPSAMEEREQSYIILHEQHHIRRLDHVVKALAFAALCIHWFNPLVWVAFILSGKDMEMSCDEAVVKKLGDGVLADYTASLLSLATGKHIIAGMPLAFGEGDTKGRIHNLANWKKPAIWVVLLAVAACVVLAVCLLTNPSSDNHILHILKYSHTNYVIDTQHTEVMTAYNRKRNALSVTINFETTEGPSIIELVYGHKKNGIGTEWTYSEPVTLMLGESTTFTVPADHHFSFTAASLEGENGNITLVFTESEAAVGNSDDLGDVTPQLSPEGVGKWLVNPAELISGTTYVPYQCIYMNPLSSYAAFGGDSGCQYIVGEDYFATIYRNVGAVISVEGLPDLDTAGSGLQNMVDVPKWEWQEFPYTDKEWGDLYWPEGFGTQNIREMYDEILYQPLTAGRFLLCVDGDLWLVELGSNERMGTYLWSIYSLVPESVMGVAQWEFAPLLSSRLPVFRFGFDMDYTEISATCVDSLLVNWDTPSAPSDTSMVFRQGNALYWSPMDKDGNIVSKATIRFTVHDGEAAPYHGTIYIESTGGSGGRTVYTARLVGTGLHLEPNSEREGGMITAVSDVPAAKQVVEYDLRSGELEVPVEDIDSYVFFTNSTQISVTVRKGAGFAGSITLLDISQGNAEIRYADVSGDDNDALFTGLTAARRYRLDCEGLEGCVLIVSG